MAKTILGIDLGAQTGWAVIKGRKRKSGAKDFSGSSLQRWVDFQQWLKEVFAEWKPAVVVFEKPCGPYVAIRALQSYVTLIWVACGITGAEPLEVSPNTLKKFATGSGRASGLDVKNAARAKWMEQNIHTEHQAAALWLAEYGRVKG